jgi:hypothetical protein
MLLIIVRWVTFLALVAVTTYYVLRTGGHPEAVAVARDRITIAAVLWALTLLRKRQPAAAVGLHGTARFATKRDLQGLLVWGTEHRPGAFVLGAFGRRTMALPPELATHHVLIVGPPAAARAAPSSCRTAPARPAVSS